MNEVSFRRSCPSQIQQEKQTGRQTHKDGIKYRIEIKVKNNEIK